MNWAQKNWLLFQIIFPIVLGSLIYLLFRPKEIVLFKVIGWLGVMPVVQSLRDACSSAKPLLPGWFVFSLPNALWVYSMSVFLITVWREEPRKMIYWLCCGWVIAIGFELLQASEQIPGTFSFVDLGMILTACILSKLLN